MAAPEISDLGPERDIVAVVHDRVEDSAHPAASNLKRGNAWQEKEKNKEQERVQ
jgi:hypothetical protein